MYILAEFWTDFADSGQAALAESSDQGLQCLSIYKFIAMLGMFLKTYCTKFAL